MAESVRKHLAGACSIVELLLAYVRTVPRYSKLCQKFLAVLVGGCILV